MKKELKNAIESFSIVNHNKKIMIDILGEDNLKNFPFQIVKVKLAESQSQGTEILEVNVKTFRNQHYCDVAGMQEMMLNQNMVERIGKQMINDLGFSK